MADNRNGRIIFLKCVMLLVGVVFIMQLFNLQVIHGEEYREQAQNRTLRKTQFVAPRGEILDRYGEVLATNREGYNIMIYRSKLESEERNEMILKLINIFNKWEITYRDTFPIKYENNALVFENESKERSFRKTNKFEDKTIDEILAYYVEKYDIQPEYTVEQKRNVIAIRYDLERSGYSTYTAYEIATDVSKEVIVEIEERSNEFPGVSIEEQPIRYYPNKTLASHILGYIGKISPEEYAELKSEGYFMNDNIGQDGIESVMEPNLRGSNATKSIEIDEYGRYIITNNNSEIITGDQVYLTIDAKLQEVAENSLEDVINKIATGHFADGSTQAKSGAVIAIDVNTGEILAMASYPDYDPNLFVKGISTKDWKELNNETRPMFNRNILGLYSPGSIYKMVVAVAALETDTIGTNTIIKDEGRYTKYPDYQPKCWVWTPSTQRTHGDINVSGAIQYSCNYFFYAVSEMIGIDKIEEYTKLFGLGAKTGIELPGEKTGIVAGRTYANKIGEKWMPGDTLSAAIGQSKNSFTPIQIARYIAILANGGKRIEPHIIKSVITSEGKVIDNDELQEYLDEKLGREEDTLPEDLNISKSTLDAIFAGMESVTGDSGGTAYNTFKDFGVKVAGKTGTVQVGGNKADNAWFLGFAPYDNPEIAICSVIEQGSHGTYTASIVKAILEEYFALKQENENIDTNTVVNNNQMM